MINEVLYSMEHVDSIKPTFPYYQSILVDNMNKKIKLEYSVIKSYKN
jgi:hypothetical protein